MRYSLNDRVRIERRATEIEGATYSDDTTHSDGTSYADAPIQDGYGNVQAAWASLGNFRATVIDRSGGEDVRAAKVAGVGVVEVFMRASSVTRGLMADDRIVDLRSGALLNVRHVQEQGRNRHYVMATCERGGAHG